MLTVVNHSVQQGMWVRQFTDQIGGLYVHVTWRSFVVPCWWMRFPILNSIKQVTLV